MLDKFDKLLNAKKILETQLEECENKIQEIETDIDILGSFQSELLGVKVEKNKTDALDCLDKLVKNKITWNRIWTGVKATGLIAVSSFAIGAMRNPINSVPTVISNPNVEEVQPKTTPVQDSTGKTRNIEDRPAQAPKNGSSKNWRDQLK